MEFYLLGTGTLVPEAHRGPSGYLLRGPQGWALVDSGSGTLGRIAGMGVDFREIGSCLYTHRHPDHTADLVPFLFGRKYMPAPTNTLIRVWGPPKFPEFVTGLQVAWQGWASPEGRYPMEILEVPSEGGVFDVVGIQTRAIEVHHSDPAVAYRFEDSVSGSTLCYSGDTEYCPGILEAAKNVDVLVIECSFPDIQKAPGHLTPTGVARIAREANARRVLLTHLYPVAPPESLRVACERELGRTVEIARDGMSILLS